MCLSHFIKTRVGFLSVKWKVEYLLFIMVTHQDYYQKIASLIADVPPQIVIVSMSHSFAE